VIDAVVDRSFEVLPQQSPVMAVVDLLGVEQEALAHQIEEVREGRDRGGDEVALDARDRRLARARPGGELPLAQAVPPTSGGQERTCGLHRHILSDVIVRRERAPVTLAAVRGIVLAIVALSLLAAQQASAGTSMFVGAAEDNVRSLDPLATKAKMDLAALAGLSVVRMTATWSPGEYEVSGDDRIVLQNVSAAAQLDGVRVILATGGRRRCRRGRAASSRSTPRRSRARSRRSPTS
jgi:hypothetical protein